MSVKNRSVPCSQCAFRITCPPGALGGSPPETFIGQAHGPFIVPCHMSCDFDDPDWKDKANEVSQCAGLAMYRQAQGLREKLPEQLVCLEPNGETFTTPEEFFAHHMGCSLEVAQDYFKILTPEKLAAYQMRRADNRYYKPEDL